MIPALEAMLAVSERATRQRFALADDDEILQPAVSREQVAGLVEAALSAVRAGEAAHMSPPDAVRACYLSGVLNGLGLQRNARQLLENCASFAADQICRAHYKNTLGMLLTQDGELVEAGEIFRDALIDVGSADTRLAAAIAANLAAVSQLTGRFDQVARWTRFALNSGDVETRLAATSVRMAVAALNDDPFSAPDIELAMAYLATTAFAEQTATVEQARIVAQAGFVAFQGCRLRADVDGMRSAAGSLQQAAQLISARSGALTDESLTLHALSANCELDIARLERSVPSIDNATEMLTACAEGFENVYGKSHSKALIVRANEALAIAESARLRGAVAEIRAGSSRLATLGARLNQVLGQAHPACITVASNIAAVELDLARADQSPEAVHRASELFERARDISAEHLGDNHPMTIVIRRQLKTCRELTDGRPGETFGSGGVAILAPPMNWGGLGTGPDGLQGEYLTVGDAAKRSRNGRALPPEMHTPSALRELENAMLRALETPGHATLAARSDVAYWTGHAGRRVEALRMFEEILEEQRTVRGDDDPETLTTASNVAYWQGRTGDLTGAIERYRAVLDARVAALGQEHPDTLRVFHNMAIFYAAAGDREPATTIMRYVVEARRLVLGADHRDTHNSLRRLAEWSAG
ncbi:tetratricopeptide repeat protein [Actinoplanes sp. NBC_00393]|uniref:tetratricopeptide repeat protein n=1 Tax=Actinoplanes sp. NBC_00393 TaxID=2975953 RepID=UPI002E1DA3D9